LNKRGFEIYKSNEEVELVELRQIFDKYCECTKGFPVGVNYSDPPNFDAADPVVEVSERGSKITIAVERKTSQRRLRYTIIKGNEGMRVSDQVKILDPNNNKYVSFDILL
jgi:hypothetical protein